MQTFLPYPSFVESARCLDRQRLGKQRVEAWQLLLGLHDPSYGWQNHPAMRMWRGYSLALAHYGLAICNEWKHRGYKDAMWDRFYAFVPDLNLVGVAVPPWWGNDDFHASHRGNLLRKDPVWYGQYGWKESPDLEYVWP